MRLQETAGVHAQCSDLSKNCSVKALSSAGDGVERIGSCAGIGVASVQGRLGGRTGEGKETCKAYGGSLNPNFHPRSLLCVFFVGKGAE